MIELQDVSEVIYLLLSPECEQALPYWNDVLEPYLGRDVWLTDGGAALTELLNYWAPDSRDELIAATQQGSTDGGSALNAWLEVAVRQTQSQADSLEGYYPQPEQAVAQDDSGSAGSIDEGAVPVVTWYVGEPQPVSGYEGWWAVADPSGQWWAVQTVERPDAETVGWLPYEEAFAAPETEEAAWVEGRPRAEPAYALAVDGSPIIGARRSAVADSSQASDLMLDEPVDEDERWAELVDHNKEVLAYTKNGTELPLVIVRSPGGMLVGQTGGYGCLLAPTAQVLHSRDVFFEGTAGVRRDKFHFYLDFIGIPPEYRSACSCCLGYVPGYDMNFVDSAGAQIPDSGAFLPYGQRFGGSVDDPIPIPPDLENAAEINAFNLESLDAELQWQLGRNGLLLIGSRMLDEDAGGFPGFHSQQNLSSMGESLPGHVVGGGRISWREDRRGRVTAYVFHSVKGGNRDALTREAKRALPKMKFEFVESR